IAAVMNCFDVILPLFQFALYLDRGTLRFPEHLRQLAKIAAITLLAVVMVGLPASLRSLSVYWANLQVVNWKTPGAFSMVAGAPVTQAQVSALLGFLSNVATILLLYTMSTQPEADAGEDQPISSLLRDTARIAVIAWALWIAFQLFRIGS